MTQHRIERVDVARLAAWLDGRTFAEWRAQYDEAGFVVFRNVLPPAEIGRLRDVLQPYLTKTGRNDFEGFKSNRVYALLAKAPEVFSDLATHPLPLAFAEAELGDTCLLSALLAINLHPGETVQGWHHDDASISVPRPRTAFGVSAFWTIDETTADNGATELIPRSHLWADGDFTSVGESIAQGMNVHAEDISRDPQPRSDAIKVTLPAGSLIVAKGTLWHRGGANTSNRSRLIVTAQFCPGWARQLENMVAAVPREIAAELPKRTRQLLGYNIHSAFMGYVDGVHPDTVLGIDS